MHLFVIAISIVIVATSSVIADSLIVPNPQDWANAQNNEQPVNGDSTTGTVGGDSWVSVPSNKAHGHHLLYFQGNLDSNNPQDANPNNSNNPQLFFQDSEKTDSPTVGEIRRLSWDTKKSSESTANDHWFVAIYTKEKNKDPNPSKWYDHQVTFSLTDSKNYNKDSWNTLEADQNNSESIGDEDSDGNLEVAVYDQRRMKYYNDLSDYPAKTFSNWADDNEKPEWWDDKIIYIAIGTNPNHNNMDNIFISNIDNIQVSFHHDSSIEPGIKSRQLDLSTVPLPNSAWMVLSLLGLVGGSAILRRCRAVHNMT